MAHTRGREGGEGKINYSYKKQSVSIILPSLFIESSN